MLISIWRYRHFIVSSIRNEFLARFARSKLGGLWMIIHPLTQVLIFALILSEVLSAKLPGIENKYAYALYLMAGTLFWSLFSDTITRCLTLFIDNGNLMKKMAFPRICLPVIALGTVLVNNILLFAAIFIVFAAMGHFPNASILWLPILMLLAIALGLGMGLILGVINVFVRDVGQVVPVILQTLFWLTPIVYSVSIIPESYRRWMLLNPLFSLVVSYQNILVFNKQPLWTELTGLALWTAVILAIALFMFRRASADMVDAL